MCLFILSVTLLLLVSSYPREEGKMWKGGHWLYRIQIYNISHSYQGYNRVINLRSNIWFAFYLHNLDVTNIPNSVSLKERYQVTQCIDIIGKLPQILASLWYCFVMTFKFALFFLNYALSSAVLSNKSNAPSIPPWRL